MTRADGGYDAVVVGGGLAGLAAAAWIARAGRRALVLERARALGGRAATDERDGFFLNVGPHALYRGGAAAPALCDLGVEFTGGVPLGAGGYLVDARGAHTLPIGALSLLSTGYMGLGAKLELARFLARLPGIDAAALDGVPLADWVERAARRPAVRRFLHALARLTTYSNAPDTLSAGAAVRQMQIGAAANVWYVDGGWATIIESLRAIAVRAGAEVRTGAAVAAVERDAAGAVRGVRLADGTAIEAPAVVLAIPPAAAAALLGGGTSVAAHARAAVPVKAASLDLGLARLPRPRATFALGVDAPLYLSVHSATARLAPEGAALVHVLKYLPPGATAEDGAAAEPELEALMDLVQPGWRDAVRVRRFLPAITVAPSTPTAAAGGLAGRPRAVVDDVPGLFLAGDWVGEEGMLADASLASARAAAAGAIRVGAAAGTEAGA